MHKRSPLSQAEREMVATEVSRLNGCEYCLHHHHTGLKRLLPEDRHERCATLRDGRLERSHEREQAMVDVRPSSSPSTPHDMDEHDVERCASRLDDRAILDLAQCIGYFNYVNRIVTGLGVRPRRRRRRLPGSGRSKRQQKIESRKLKSAMTRPV